MVNNGGIFLPSGVLYRQPDVVALHPREAVIFVVLAKVAQRLGIGIHCSKCGEDITGKNDGHDKTLVVSCKCREFRGDMPTNIRD